MLNVSTLSALVVAAYLVIFGFMWRLATAYLSDTALGRGMSFIY